MILDLAAPLMTRDGRQALLIGRCPEPHDGYVLAVAIKGHRGEWCVESYHEDGTYFPNRRPSMWDLANAAPSATVQHIRDATRPLQDCQGERVTK